MSVDQKVGLIGFGMMGQALAKGLLSKEIVSKGNLMAADAFVAFENIPWLTEFQVKTTTENLQCIEFADVIILCIKPFFVDDCLAAIKAANIQGMERKLIVSLVSGYSLERLHSFELGTSRVIRMMPNTAALVGAASTAISCNPNVPSEDRELVKTMMSAIGGAWEIPEKRMNIWTAVAGAGPAYVFQFIEALKDSAIAGGIPHNVATEMAVQVVMGAAKMAAEAPNTHLAQLRENVCSPAGVTIRGVQALQEGGFIGTVMRAVDTAKMRYDAVEANPNI